MKKSTKKDSEDLWEENTFIEAINPKDMEEKMKTFHKKHDEDMNFNCKECNKTISSHNKDWHDNMCDECFDKNY